ncbi:MAG: glycerophosphodiester phosphodiesterase [Gammaproteobacteria bacterium]|nr:MAG: glycerophosphodiester phosphodiesterase [Gammaproteobacteria bacterium]
MKIATLLIVSLLLSGCVMSPTSSLTPQTAEAKIVIAHRGASGYLPEHSIASKAMAYAMGVDYIEQDVVMTKDDVLVVLHDPYLDRVTNVMTVFPNRSRVVFGQRRWLAIDFTLSEIKRLSMTEAFSVDEKSKQLTASYSQRFPLFKSSFRVSTLKEEIELIQGLNKSTGNKIGVYVEIKAPWFHLAEGKDISKATLELVKSFGYKTKQDNIFIQCFDPDETKRIKQVLMPELAMDLKLVQLIAETSWNETMRITPEGTLTAYNYDWMFEPGAMEKIAQYADAIGPWKPMLVDDKSTRGNLIITDMTSDAHKAGMLVHPYTFRSDDGRIPDYAENFEQLLEIFYFKVGVDGLFTDFPDKAVNYLKALD